MGMLHSLSNGPGVYLSPSGSGVDHISSASRWSALPIHPRPGEASMLRKKAEIFSVVTWVVILGCLASSAFAARKEKVLYSFCSEQSCNGFQGPSNLILDAAGNLYGTTIYGGHDQQWRCLPTHPWGGRQLEPERTVQLLFTSQM